MGVPVVERMLVVLDTAESPLLHTVDSCLAE